MKTDDYRLAVEGASPDEILNFNWKDKPHRLVYDLCSHVELLESYLCAISFDEGMTFGHGVKLIEDGLDRQGFVNMDFYPSAVAQAIVYGLEGFLRGGLQGIEDAYVNVEEHQARRAKWVTEGLSPK